MSADPRRPAVLTVDGRIVAVTDDYATALAWVLDHAVTGDLEDPGFDALARLHRRMAGYVDPGLPRLIDHLQALHP